MISNKQMNRSNAFNARGNLIISEHHRLQLAPDFGFQKQLAAVQAAHHSAQVSVDPDFPCWRYRFQASEVVVVVEVATTHHPFVVQVVCSSLMEYSSYYNHQLSGPWGFVYPCLVWVDSFWRSVSYIWCDWPSPRLSLSFWGLLTYRRVAWRKHDFPSQFFQFLFFSSPCSNL